MLNFNQFKSQNIGIYGLGITGSSIAETLKFNGANVYIWDDNPEIRRKFIKKNFILKEILMPKETILEELFKLV